MSDRVKTGNRLMLAGVVLLLCAVILLLYNLNRDWDAKNASYEIISELDNGMSFLAEQETQLPEAERVYPDDMDSVFIEGYEYIGYVTIPYLEIELPVCKTYAYEKLKVAPCRYAGNVADGSLVICAHNYRSHFGRLSRLSAGAEVRFKDVHGNVTLYRVSGMEVLSPRAIREIKVSDADLTLFTCTYGGRTRYVVRCQKENRDTQ